MKKIKKKKRDFAAGVFQKGTLIFFGTVLCLIILEIALRAGGAAFFALQDIRNRINHNNRDQHVVLCLGESITAFGGDNSYPRQLEKVLNNQSKGKKFKVINKGVPATNSSAIYAKLPEYIEQYDPDIVTIMMGVNDQSINPVTKGAAKQRSPEWAESLRVYKLFRHFKDNIKRQSRKKHLDRSEPKKVSGAPQYVPVTDEELKLKQALLSEPYNVWKYYNLGHYYMQADRHQEAYPILLQAMNVSDSNEGILLDLAICYKKMGNFELAQDYFQKVQELYPENQWAYLESGRTYMEEGRHEKAKQAYEKLIRAKPELDLGYLELGSCIRIEGQYEKAYQLIKKAIALNPQNDVAWLELGWSHKYLADYKNAETCMKKALKINKNNIRSYFSLGWLYINSDKIEQATDTFKQGLEIDPEDEQILMGLATCYMLSKDYDDARMVYERILKKHPNNKKAFGGLALVYAQQGKRDLAEEYYQTGDQSSVNWFTLTTQHNYKQVIGLLHQKGIGVICVSYPNQTIIPLKHVLQGQHNITFVDNKHAFQQAVDEHGYAEYFSDTFAGDFGHCTAKGNRILAENIAEAILADPRVMGSKPAGGM